MSVAVRHGLSEWFVPPILVPVFLALLIGIAAVTQW